MNIIKKLLSKTEADIAVPSASKSDVDTECVNTLTESVPYEAEETDLSGIIESIKEDASESKGEPVDAKVEMKVAADNMSVTIILHAPENGGKDITVEDVHRTLSSAEITYGINSESISRMVTSREYGKQFVGASGQPAKNGVDGRINEVVPRVRTLSFIEDDRGDIDFKHLNLVNQVVAGTVLCEIVPAEEPISGMDVYGRVVEGKPGRAPVAPMGENTSLSEDGSKLVASKAGNLVYSKDRFSIGQKLEIPNNIDASTGNIEFSGDVTIRGSVLEGYTVRAGGNIIVYGVVEGAYIYAGGDVRLMQGINGMSKGIIEAKGSIKCRYLENCTIRVDGSVSAEYILHSNVYSGNSITVTGARSSIIGGTSSAYQTIEVKTVGNKMNTMTVIMLGATKEMIEERKNLMSEIKEHERQIHNYSMDLRFIERLVKENAVTDKHRTILLKIQEEYPKSKDRLDQCRIRYQELVELISNNSNSRLTCQRIFPPTRIIVGSESVMVQEERFRCDVYYSEGEIKFAYR